GKLYPEDHLARRENSNQAVDALVLQPLRVIRAYDAETDGCGERAAACVIQDEALRCWKAHAQGGKRRPARGSGGPPHPPPPPLQIDQRVRRPYTRAGGEKRAALDTARAVGNGVRQKCLRQRVEYVDAVCGAVCRGHERQRAIRCLPQQLPEEIGQMVSIELAGLPCP